MEIPQLVEDGAGVSRFSRLEIAMRPEQFAPPAPEMLASAPEPCRQLRFLVLPPGWTGPKHRSPRRQLIFCMAGRMRFTAGDGEAVELKPGDLWWTEDVTGSGHSSEVLGDREARLAVVQLD